MPPSIGVKLTPQGHVENYDINILQSANAEAFVNEVASLRKRLGKGMSGSFTVITDSNLAQIYDVFLRQVTDGLSSLTGTPCRLINTNTQGEETKSFSVYQDLCEQLISQGITRSSALIAFGGGTIGDVTGFVASTILRGIHHIQVPTTLLSMVDSSVGGKTGINTQTSKNMVGAFWQPSLVWCNLAFLDTLPHREALCGLAEVIKYALIRSTTLAQYLQSNKPQIASLSKQHIAHLVYESCRIKQEIVSQDEKETENIRSTLNFGHTIGHAIEKAGLGDEGLKHGEAVAIGMLLEAYISHHRGLLNQQDLESAISLITAYSLTQYVHSSILQEVASHSPNVWMKLLKCISMDKKNTEHDAISLSQAIEGLAEVQAAQESIRKFINFSLLEGPGKCGMHRINVQDILPAVKSKAPPKGFFQKEEET